VLEVVEGIEPMTIDNMRVIVERSWKRVQRVFQEGND
jgi:hypothetical protein